MYLRVSLVLCLIGPLAALLAQETDHGEETDAVLEGKQRNKRYILSRHRRMNVDSKYSDNMAHTSSSILFQRPNATSFNKTQSNLKY